MPDPGIPGSGNIYRTNHIRAPRTRARHRWRGVPFDVTVRHDDDDDDESARRLATLIWINLTPPVVYVAAGVRSVAGCEENDVFGVFVPIFVGQRARCRRGVRPRCIAVSCRLPVMFGWYMITFRDFSLSYGWTDGRTKTHMYSHTHTHTHIYIYIYIYTHTHTHTRTITNKPAQPRQNNEKNLPENQRSARCIFCRREMPVKSREWKNNYHTTAIPTFFLFWVTLYPSMMKFASVRWSCMYCYYFSIF